MKALIDQYLIDIKIAIAVLFSAALFCAGWMTNGWRKDAEIQSINATQERESTQAQIDARIKERSFNKQLEESQHAAKEREKKLLADRDNARNESERLRGDIAAIRGQLPSLTEAAVRQYADTASVVFDECQRKYQELAATADLIDSDRQTLIDAWLK